MSPCKSLPQRNSTGAFHATSVINRPAARFRSSLSLTDVAENDGQEDESVGGADEDDAKVHPEVEDLEDLRLGEGQHDDPTELGQRDP